MPTPNETLLSRNEQAMLDLALLCDLQMAKEEDKPAIKARHAKIKTQGDALVYIRNIEHRIHAARKVTRLPSRGAAAEAGSRNR
jgi:hypothetical protein